MSALSWVLGFLPPRKTLEDRINEVEQESRGYVSEALQGGREKRILYVCATPPMARARAIEMGYPVNVQFGWFGCMFAGFSYDEAIIDLTPDPSASKALDQRYLDDWIAQQVRTRLNVGGRLRYLQ